MPYVFPTPSQVPYEVKQKVMNHVYPKKWSLIKRSLFVKAISGYSLFLGVVILFSRLYLKTYSNSPSVEKFTNKEIASVPKDSSITYITENTISNDPILVKSQDLDNIELTLLETENLLSELETLI